MLFCLFLLLWYLHRIKVVLERRGRVNCEKFQRSLHLDLSILELSDLVAQKTPFFGPLMVGVPEVYFKNLGEFHPSSTLQSH